MFDFVGRALGAVLLVLNIAMSGPGQGPAESRQLPVVAQDTQQRAVIQRPIPKGGRKGSLRFARTELYFGTARPDGAVSDAEFRKFLDSVVTPRFPDGLTLIEADGQFRGADGTLIKERSFVLILLYPYETFDKATRSVEVIRALYKTQFDQESVLRVDDPFVVWVSF
jgi:uncharacterized protein DUF3574